jgi:hypothetical protein
MPFQSTPVVGYYTFKPILVLNLVIANSKLECNQLLTRLEQLCNLEQRPSHRLGFQQPMELVEVVVALVAIQQTQQRHQIVLPNRLVMGIIE